METTGLKEEDSSVEIYIENVLTDEARHKRACTHAQTHTHGHRKDKYEHMHVKKQDSTGKGTEDRDTEDTC